MLLPGRICGQLSVTSLCHIQRYASSTTGRQKLVILGTGWSSYAVLKKIDKKLYDVIVVSPRNHFLFTPLLCSTTVGTLEFRSIIESVRNTIFRETGHFHLSRATGIDFDKRVLQAESVLRPGLIYDLNYDKLIIGVGSLSNTFGTPGVTENAFFLKEVADARKIRNRILSNFELATEPTVDPEESRRLLHIVIVGGGPTGVEFGAEIYDFVEQDVSRLYKAKKDDVRVTLVESNQILSSFDVKLRQYAERKIKQRRGFKLEQDSVTAVHSDHVHLKNAGKIPCGLVVWSTGLAPRDFVKKLDVPKNNRGQILTDQQLHVLGDPSGNAYALGDCADIRDRSLPCTAQELDHVFDSHFGEAPPLPDAPASDPADGDDDVEAAGQPSVDHLARQFCDNGSGTAENECTSNDNHIVEDTNTCEQICRTECGCTKNCMSQFTQDEIEQNILLLRELEKTEKEMLLMGVLKQCGIDKKHVTERKRVRYSYVYRNQRVCRQAFQLLYDTKERTLDNIQKHMQSHGATPRVHANTGRRPHNAFKFDEIKDAVQFVVNYAEQYGLPQPAASRGQDTAPPVFLPCSDTKHSIHMVYRSGCEERGARPLGLSSFKDVWSQCVPHIKISSPRQDVCHVCELLRRRIQDAVGDTQKLKATTEFQDHLMKAQVEKEAYQLSVRRSLEELADVDKETRPVPAMSTAFTKIHYTFDFSQQLQIPHHARQMGPIYFTVPRKVQLFGVRLDGIPHQYNYLVDEAQTIGVNGSKTHGPDAVISMLHHAFTSYSFGENECLIHADNCGGQNKNRYVIAYFAWRVMTGKHQQITYMMQVPGHARCLVDSNFAHIKRRYKRSDVDSLLQLRDVVDKSACSNTAVMYGQEDSWHWCDWKGFLGDVFLPMKGIRSCQVFRFHADHPGVVFTKSSAAGEEKRVLILRKGCTVDTSALPTELAPGGIDDERRHYLFTHIRKFVRDPWKDLTCPPANAEE